nr:actin cytoskeleton-regulatory complex protein PAN1-like [Aegilops tauschii subsp. strangulata]
MPPKKYLPPRAVTASTAAVAQPKQRKPRAPPSKPPDMSNADWRAEVQRREAVTTDRRNRANAKKARDSAALAAAAAADQAERSAEQAEAARLGMMNPSGGHAQYAPWSYADGGAHGGFNPNITFPHGHPAQRTPSPTFAGVQYPPYNYSPPAYASSPTLPFRRGALPFSQASTLHLGDTDATEADMEDIITAGSAAAAASPGFATQDKTVDLDGDMDGELEYGKEEPDKQEEEDGEEEKEDEPAPVPARRRKKKKGAARTDEPRIKWASKEQECLAEAWKVVCPDPITGMNQEKTEARWSALMTSSAVKLDLLRTNVAAKKRNTDLAFLLGGADMIQSTDEAVKTWYLAERGLILNQLPSSAPPTPTPTPTPPPSPSDEASTTPSSTEATPTPPSSTEATPTPPSTEEAPTPPSPRTPTPPTPETDPAA